MDFYRPFSGNTIQQIFPNDSQLPKMIGESVRKDDASLLEKLIKSKSLKDDKYCHLIQGKALLFFILMRIKGVTQ